MRIRVEEQDAETLRLTQSSFSRTALLLILEIQRLNPGVFFQPAGYWTFPRSILPKVIAAFKGDIAVPPSLMPKSDRPVPALPADYKFADPPPYDHQRIAFGYGVAAVEFAYLMEMGTGKTRALIDVWSYLIQRDVLRGVLMVCPKAVVFNWEREIARYSPLPPERKRTAVLVRDGAARARDGLEAASATCSFIITNYEAVPLMADELARMMLTRDGRWGIGCDESTYIKSATAERSKAIWKIGKFAARRAILTGSPITQSPLDAYGQFRFLNLNILGHQTYTSFKSEYVRLLTKGPLAYKKIIGHKNLDRLAGLIAKHSYRVLKSECLDLPPKSYRTVELEMGPKQAALYIQMRDKAILSLQGQTVAAPIVLTKLLRLAQIAGGFVPLLDEFGKDVGTHEIEDSPKLGAASSVTAEALESGQKVIIWARFRWEIAKLAISLKDFGVVEYHGDVSTEDRQRVVDAFQTSPSTRVFIGQIQTGGMGITLTAASTVIYFSNTFSLAERLQSEDRAHRIGQEKPVLYVDLCCRKTVDQLVLKALRSKKDVADYITGDNFRTMLTMEQDDNRLDY